MSDSLGVIILISIAALLGGTALIQLLELPFRSTASYEIFRLAVVNASGCPAGVSDLLVRWAILWLPLLVSMFVVGLLAVRLDPAAAVLLALLLLLLWVSAAVYAVIHPNRGLHDRFAGTWVVRR